MNIEQFKGLARLPKFAIPSHYDLHLKLDLSAACTFYGTVKINLSITEKTNFLVLNANQLRVHQALFTTSGNQVYTILWLIIMITHIFLLWFVVILFFGFHFCSNIVPLMLLWMMMMKWLCWFLMKLSVLEKGCWGLSFLGNLMST